jgi:hypothetical protein
VRESVTEMVEAHMQEKGSTRSDDGATLCLIERAQCTYVYIKGNQGKSKIYNTRIKHVQSDENSKTNKKHIAIWIASMRSRSYMRGKKQSHPCH